MGRFVRRFIRAFKINQGTDAAPITVNDASIIAHEIAHSVTVAGTSEGLKATMEANLTSGNLSLYAIHGKVSIATGKNIGTGNVRGGYIETEALGTAIIGGMMEGLDIETYVESGATITGDHYGIYVKTYSDIAGSKSIFPLRLEHNGASVAEAFIGLYNQTAKMTYLLESSNTAELWCGVTGTPTTIAGWLRIRLGGYTRWIALYSVSP